MNQAHPNDRKVQRSQLSLGHLGGTGQQVPGASTRTGQRTAEAALATSAMSLTAGVSFLVQTFLLTTGAGPRLLGKHVTGPRRAECGRCVLSLHCPCTEPVSTPTFTLVRKW